MNLLAKITDLRKYISSKPQRYALYYLTIIPLFGLIYYMLPSGMLNIEKPPVYNTEYLITCLYFSVTTITTLGYGDISPTSSLGQILTMAESIIGIIIIGLFLNSISHTLSEKSIEKEKNLQLTLENKENIRKLNAFNKIVEVTMTRHYKYMGIITNPSQHWKGNKLVNNDNPNRIFSEDLKFSDLQYFFRNSNQYTDNLFKPVMDYYYKSLNEFISSVEEMVKLGIVNPWPDLEELCLNFLVLSKELDYSEYILGQRNVTVSTGSGGKVQMTGSEYDQQTIKDCTDPTKLNATFNCYLCLFRFLKETHVFIVAYRTIIKNINN